MTNLRVCFLVLASCLVVSFIGFSSEVEQREFTGNMFHNTDNEGIYLMTLDGLEKVDLFFPFDDENELIIEDFGNFGSVKIKGHYFEWSNILKVEEISEGAPLPVL